MKFLIVIIWLFLFAICMHYAFAMLTSGNIVIFFSGIIVTFLAIAASYSSQCGTKLIKK